MLRKSAIGLATGIVAAVAMITFASAAGAQQDYPGDASLTLSTSTVAPGGSVTATTEGCAPGEAIDYAFDSTPVGSTTADSAGAGSLTFTVPTGTASGTHTVTSTCGALVLSTTVSVTASGTTPGTSGTGTLPRTGSDNTNLLRAGALLVAAGGAVVLVTRKRNSRSKADA